MSAVIAGGFTDAARDAQAVFRAALTAFAEPGTLPMLGRSGAPPQGRPLPPARPPLLASAFALALTLIDGDTSLFLDCPDEALAGDLRFHCGCPVVADPSIADFAILVNASSLARLGEFAPGTVEYPDRSTTLIVQIERLGRGVGFRLTGPGIASSRDVAITGLPANFPTLWQANRRYWPRGVDLLLTDGERLLGLPRTTRLEAI